MASPSRLQPLTRYSFSLSGTPTSLPEGPNVRKGIAFSYRTIVSRTRLRMAEPNCTCVGPSPGAPTVRFFGRPMPNVVPTSAEGGSVLTILGRSGACGRIRPPFSCLSGEISPADVRCQVSGVRGENSGTILLPELHECADETHCTQGGAVFSDASFPVREE